MMAAPSTGELLLIGLGFLGFNVLVGILIWTALLGCGAVGAVAREVDHVEREGREGARQRRHSDARATLCVCATGCVEGHRTLM